MGVFNRRADHHWSQQHLSHYVEGDLSPWARRRLELHAEECPDCSRGIRALRALLRLIHGSADAVGVRAPATIYDRVRADVALTVRDSDQTDGR